MIAGTRVSDNDPGLGFDQFLSPTFAVGLRLPAARWVPISQRIRQLSHVGFLDTRDLSSWDVTFSPDVLKVRRDRDEYFSSGGNDIDRW